jgi:hypothetical protein
MRMKKYKIPIICSLDEFKPVQFGICECCEKEGEVVNKDDLCQDCFKKPVVKVVSDMRGMELPSDGGVG